MKKQTKAILSSPARTVSRYCFYLILILFSAFNSQAQISITTPYPSPAQPLTLNSDTSLLTVEVLFSGACSSNTASIRLTPGVTYVPGSIQKISGTAGISIAYLGGTANKPDFSITGVTSGGGLTFTIKRIAGCGSGASGKDTVSVTGSCGSAIENNPGVNSYDILSPSLVITPPVAITNAVTGVTYPRNLTITNGGNGCLDTLRFYLVYPGGDIQLQSLYAGATLLTPYLVNGDTSFFKLAGTALSADKILCNGENVAFTENIRLRGCANTITTYKAGWGRSMPGGCNWISNTSSVTVANGVPSITGIFTRVQQLNWCQKGVFNITYTNTASSGSGVAAAAYNFIANIGYNNTTNATVPTGFTAQIPARIDSIRIGSVTVPFIAATASTPARGNFSGLASDPDAAGSGLEDIDGDGQFDDLGPGRSVTITVYEEWLDRSASCPIPTYRFFTSHTAGYATMCGTAYTTNPLPATGSYSIQSTTGNVVVPAQVTGGTPFSVQLCMNLSSMFEPVYKPKDSLYLDITLPPGVALSGTGNITYNGVAVPVSGYYTEPVGIFTILHIRRKGKSNNFCFSADFVYTCTGPATTISPVFNLYYQGDTCSASREKYLCATRNIAVRCPTPCPDGIVNYQPVANRVNLGWTDQTLTTKVSAASVTGTAKYSALPLDTVRLVVTGRQIATGVPYNNLYYNLQFAKVASTDVFAFVSGTFNQRTGAVTNSSAIGSPTNLASTTTLQKLLWNLSSNLTSGIISNGDSVWLDLRFTVTRANNDLLFGNSLQQVASTSSTLYNVNGLGVKVACDSAHAINLLVAGYSASNYTPAITISNCNAVSASSNQYEGNSTGKDIFPNEYRPQSIIDSVVITLPAGYVLFPTTNTMNAAWWSAPTTFNYMGAVGTGVVIDRGSNTYVIQNPNLSSGGWRLADLGNSASPSYPLGYFISPTCAAVTGTQNYSARWYYRDGVYTGNVAAYNSKAYTVSAAIINNTVAKPALSIQNNSGTIAGILPQHYWDVQINSTGSGTASYVWMALDRTGSNITVDSVVYGGTVISGAVYASGKSWYQLTAAGIPSGNNVVARVYFKFHSCTADSLLVSTGWNCPGYPTNPDAYVCSPSTTYLKVIPQQAQIQLSISRQPGNGSGINLCTPDSLSVIVNSAQVANVANPTVSVYPPVGITINNPVSVEYPLGSGIWQNITATPIGGGGFSINLSSLPAFVVNGMPGLNLNPGALGRQAKIQFSYTTNCSTISGSQFDFYIYGNNPCGTPATGNGSNVKSGTININGAAALTHFNSVTLTGTSFTCANTNAAGAITLNGTITNNGPGVSVANEYIILTLPANHRYVAGSIPAATFTNETIVNNANGTQTITWRYPNATPAGTTRSFQPRVWLDTDTLASCSISPSIASLRTVVTSTLNCGAITCNSFTTQNGISSLSLQNDLPDITGNIINSTADYYAPGNWTWTINGTLNNAGAAIVAGTSSSVEFYCDANNNGLFDEATDYRVGRYTTTAAIPQFGSVPFTYVNTFPSSSCNPTSGTASFFAVIRRTPIGAPKQCVCYAQRSVALNSVLPDELLSFAAAQQGQAVMLNWTTAGDNHLEFMQVERSTDGNRYTGIGRIRSRSSREEKYNLLDLDPAAGINYYRLKLTDKDGRSAYSHVQVVRINSGSSVVIYPNPIFGGDLTVQLPSGPIRSIQAYDARGTMVVNISALPNSATRINTDRWTKGLYTIVTRENGHIIRTEKVIRK